MTKLSQVNVDFVALVEQLRNRLGNYDSWIDLLESSTGQTIIEFLAGIGTTLHYSIERGSQEATGFETSLLDSSVYSLSRFLGINPKRKISAKTTVNLTLESPLSANFTIPQYSQFDIEGKQFYNPDSVRFLAGVAVVEDVTLKQGSVVKGSVVTSSDPVQSFTFSSGFAASDDVMDVDILGDFYERERRSLWGYSSTDKVFLEETLIDGSVRLQFGDGIFGVSPPVDQSINILYVETDGASSNVATSNLDVRLTSPVTVSGNLVKVEGSSTTSINGGRNQQSPEQLRIISPRLFAAGGQAVRRQDYQAIATEFPDREIIDSIVWGEYEERSTSNELMNRVKIAVLVDDYEEYEYTQTGDGSNTSFTTINLNTPIKTGSVQILEENSGLDKEYYDSEGVIYLRTNDARSGTVDYAAGRITFNPNVAPEDEATITVKYKQFGLSDSEIEAFEAHMRERMHVTTLLIYEEAAEAGISIDVTVRHHRGFNGSDVASRVEESIRALLAPRLGSLGRDFELSDITQAAVAVEGVDYVTITSPTAKTTVARAQAASLSSLTVSHVQTDR